MESWTPKSLSFVKVTMAEKVCFHEHALRYLQLQALGFSPVSQSLRILRSGQVLHLLGRETLTFRSGLSGANLMPARLAAASPGPTAPKG